MEALKTSIFSLIIVNLVNRGILTTLSYYLLVEHFKKIIKMLNVSIFSFLILNLIKKDILKFHVTTATDICIMKAYE